MDSIRSALQSNRLPPRSDERLVERVDRRYGRNKDDTSNTASFPPFRGSYSICGVTFFVPLDWKRKRESQIGSLFPVIAEVINEYSAFYPYLECQGEFTHYTCNPTSVSSQFCFV